MTTLLEDDSTLTDRYQTTVPASIRRALKLERRDRLRYTVRPNGDVVLSRVQDDTGPDPVIASFLTFLERDMGAHPETIRPLTANHFADAERLTAGMEVDLDEVLDEDDEEE